MSIFKTFWQLKWEELHNLWDDIGLSLLFCLLIGGVFFAGICPGIGYIYFIIVGNFDSLLEEISTSHYLNCLEAGFIFIVCFITILVIVAIPVVLIIWIIKNILDAIEIEKQNK